MPKSMDIVFRVDSSSVMGSGHVMRCLTLADALRERGAEIRFICRAHSGNLAALIEKRGFPISLLPAPSADFSPPVEPAHAAWLGASWEDDAAQTCMAVEKGGARPDWLVVDHYAIDHRWEAKLRPRVGRIMLIDDLADRNHDCDVLLDQNEFNDYEIRYAGKVSSSCVMLLGVRHALLQADYVEARRHAARRAPILRRIFIYFGGADRFDLTGKAVRGFISLSRHDVSADVVLPMFSPFLEGIRRDASTHGNVVLHSSLPSLAGLMSDADLAVGAGGATSWERMCLGLPSLVVTLADNQHLLGRQLHERGLIHLIGTMDTVSDAHFAEGMRHALAGGIRPAVNLMDIVDGRGVERVVQALGES